MWYSKSKYQKIGTLMNTSHKLLKTIVISKVKKDGPTFLIPKLGEFRLFDGFLDLTNLSLFDFPNLDNFFDFPNFLTCSTLLVPNLSTSPLLLFFIKASMLLLFLLKAGLLSLFLPKTSLSNNLVIFNIELKRAVIL